MKTLSSIVKARKDEIRKDNGGKRPLSPEARKSRALKALIGAMETRGFQSKGAGVFELKGTKVSTKQEGSEVIIDGKYSLALGKGAIVELDSYMKLK